MLEQQGIKLIGYASGIGAGDPGCGDGPIDLANAIKQVNLNWQWNEIIKLPDNGRDKEPLTVIKRLNSQLAYEIIDIVKQQQRFLTIGGDHSCAIGTWSGVMSALPSATDVGLIWIDAHMDAHTFWSSESSNIHGMPVAVLLGYGEPELTNLSRVKLNPKHLVQIGIRSYEAAEKKLLDKLGVKVYYADEVNQRGITTVFKEAVQYLKQHTDLLGLSIDLDGFDPSDAPAVGTPVNNGIKTSEFLPLLDILQNNPKFIGAEIAEYNPHRDQGNKTQQLCLDLIERLTYRG